MYAVPSDQFDEWQFLLVVVSRSQEFLTRLLFEADDSHVHLGVTWKLGTTRFRDDSRRLEGCFVFLWYRIAARSLG